MSSVETKTAAFCRHFGACGGCKPQDIEYSVQLERKRAGLAELFSPFWQGAVKVNPSPSCRHYRNKMEFSFVHQVASKNEDGTLFFANTFGLKLAGRWDKALDLEECGIFSEKAAALFKAVREWAVASGEEFYDLRRHTGSLRQLLVREGKNTGDALVVLYTAKPLPDLKPFILAIEAAYPQAGIFWGLNDGLGDVALAKDLQHLQGPEFLRETLPLDGNNIEARISPRSFFQTNTNAAALIYSLARRYAEKLRPQVIYDLYGGAGMFSLACRDYAQKCVCVECVPDSVADGKANAGLNGAEIEFHVATTEDFLKSPPPDLSASLCIIDPPRCGLHPKALSALVKNPPANLLYVSCNPKALERDLKELIQSYKIEFIEGFDLFPHTPHVETVAALTRH